MTRRGCFQLWAVLLIAATTAPAFGGTAASTPVRLPEPSGVIARPDTGIDASPVAKKFLIRGMTEARLKNHAEAITFFENGLEHAPNTPVLLLALADAHAARQESTTALFYAREARRLGGDRSIYFHRLAELQEQVGAYDAAIQTYKRLLRRFPRSLEAYQALARLQNDIGRPAAALSTYQQYLQQDASPPASMYRRMLSLSKELGDTESTRTALQALVELRFDKLEYARRLASVHAERKEYEKGISLLTPLVRAHPRNAALRSQFEQMYREAGRSPPLSSHARSTAPPENAASATQLVNRARTIYTAAARGSSAVDSTALGRAEDLVQRALQRSPSSVDALDLRARIHRTRKEHLEAGRLLKRALDENPRSADRWYLAAQTYADAARFDTAITLAEDGLHLFPGEARLAAISGVGHLHLRHSDRARSAFEEALNLVEADSSRNAGLLAGLYAGRGVALSQLGAAASADSSFQKALSIAPTSPVVRARYAYGLALRSERLERALALAESASEEAPEAPDVLRALGWVYYQQGMLHDAHRVLKTALQSGRASPLLLHHFGDVHRALGNEGTAHVYWKKAQARGLARESVEKNHMPEGDPEP